MNQENEAYLARYQQVLHDHPNSVIFHDFRTNEIRIHPWGSNEKTWTLIPKEETIYKKPAETPATKTT